MLKSPRQILRHRGDLYRGARRNTFDDLPSLCPICYSLKSIEPNLGQGYVWRAVLNELECCLGNAYPSDIDDYFLQLSYRAWTPVIDVLPDSETSVNYYKYGSRSGQWGLIVGAVDPALHPVRPVSRDKINYQILRDFLDSHEKRHDANPLEATSAQSPLSGLYVIDVDTMTVIPLPTFATFVALSYVWGKQGQAKDLVKRTRKEFEEGILLDAISLPLTIRDAILTTKMLGRKFLWVDRYCINFADHAHQSAMISNMDKIYAEAEFTIVALSGNHANAGLPGVSSVPRKQQGRFKAGHLTW